MTEKEAELAAEKQRLEQKLAKIHNMAEEILKDTEAYHMDYKHTLIRIADEADDG